MYSYGRRARVCHWGKRLKTRQNYVAGWNRKQYNGGSANMSECEETSDQTILKNL